MTDESQEQQPDPAVPPGWPPPPPYAAPPGWQPPPPPYGAAPTGRQGGWYPPPGQPPPYGYGYPGYSGYPRPRNTNGFAIAALVCSVVGLLLWFVGPLLGVIFGIVGLRQTTRLGEAGRGLAIAGIIIGGILLLLDVLMVIGIAVDAGSSGGISVDYHPAAAAHLAALARF